jgi:hypothetical protein
LGVEAALFERIEQVIPEGVAAQAPEQARLDAPASERKGAIGSYAPAVQLEPRREAILAGPRPGLYARQEVHVDVAEDEDASCIGGSCPHGAGILALREM